MDASSCRVRAHAKLNLSLVVLAREASGFHQIETLFCALDLADELHITAGRAGDRPPVELEVVAADEAGTPPDLGPPERNLAYRAALLFHERTAIAGSARIRLEKRIPAGGGLGGGSSDAAAVLRALNGLHGEPLDRDALLDLGARLGSDVPFFLAGAVLARAGGRGGRLMPLPPLPAAAVVLAMPAVAVSTPAAYQALAATRGSGWVCPPALLEAAPAGWDGIRAGPGNDFEDVVFRELPLLGELRDALLESGADVARMTGSGSTIFGVFRDEAAADRARSALANAFEDTRFLLTRTRTGDG
jgi:4-diphosphocytidyl-2-C-methyl-D-erythritol kinase